MPLFNFCPPPSPTNKKKSRCCVTPDHHPLLKYVLDFCAWSENKVFTPFFLKKKKKKKKKKS